ncbi:MAG: NADH:ubiquinone reductase (Na(+)-transporting) subunit D [Candidatus Riflebacteria bacterium]|nr:NADH:ubiquinone reductase (Na(+)-transporting) subunit D [Candidatus Riflebacteria bacterium]
MIVSNKNKKLLTSNIFENNPVVCSLLGLCSSLAVTNSLKSSVLMSIMVTFSLIFSCLFISLMKPFIEKSNRLIVQILSISTIVILVIKIAETYFPETCREIGPYSGLIITNCIIMGRIEAFALRSHFIPAVFDAAGSGAGYSLVICSVAILREFLSQGKVAGVILLSEKEYLFEIFSRPSGAFFGLVLFLALSNIIRKAYISNREVYR